MPCVHLSRRVVGRFEMWANVTEWIPAVPPMWLFVMAAVFIGLVVFHHSDVLGNPWNSIVGLSHRADSFEEETKMRSKN